MENSLGHSVQYIPLGVYHTGSFNALMILWCLEDNSTKMFKTPITKLCLNIKHLKSQPHLQGDSELSTEVLLGWGFVTVTCTNGNLSMHGLQNTQNNSTIRRPNIYTPEFFNHYHYCGPSNVVGASSLWSSDIIWRQGSRSTLARVMACCLTAPSHYLNQH